MSTEHQDGAEWLSQKRFAERYGYASRTVSRWVRLNMPHIGRGKNCRIHVAGALRWLNEGGARAEIAKRGQEAAL